MNDELIKKHYDRLLPSVISGSITRILWSAPVVISALAIYLIRTLPLHWVILFGVVVFLILSVAFERVTLIIDRIRTNKTNQLAPAMAQLSIDDSRIPPKRAKIVSTIEEVYRTVGTVPAQPGFQEIVWYFWTLLYLTNEGAPTNIREFKLRASLEGETIPTALLSADGFCVLRSEDHPGAIPLQPSKRILKENLVDLRHHRDDEIIEGVGRRGWLRFQIKGLASGKSTSGIKKDLDMSIEIIDGFGNTHNVALKPPIKDDLDRIKECKDPISFKAALGM